MIGMKAFRLLAVCAVVAIVASLCVAQRSTTPTLRVPLQVVRHTGNAGLFEASLRAARMPEDKRRKAVAEFGQLPADLQAHLLMMVSEEYARTNDIPPGTLPSRRLVRIKDWVRLERPRSAGLEIDHLWPTEGNPDERVTVWGKGFNADCKVLIDDVAVETYYWGKYTIMPPETLTFTVPGDIATGVDHPLAVRNTATQKGTRPLAYHVVAPRGYRGHHGWQFRNFARPKIPWHLFRDYFGASAVEYPNGTAKSYAKNWYYHVYAHVGEGGNCLGMSIASLRSRAKDIPTYHHDYFTNHAKDYTWQYPLGKQVLETVQEDHGAQCSWALFWYACKYYRHQSHREAWVRIRDLCKTPNNRPVMCFFGEGWWGGHAVVPYKTQVVGDAHRIWFYDNNRPYEEDEGRGPDKHMATVHWSSNTFSCEGADKMFCLSYDECTKLARQFGAGEKSWWIGTTVGVLNGGSVRQVTDDEGRKLLNTDGTENTDANTRIPDAIKFIPLTGNVAQAEYPDTFVFNNSAGKNLTFTAEGSGDKVFHMFMHGTAFRADFSGAGALRLLNVMTPTRGMDVPDLAALQPTSIKIIQQPPTRARTEAPERVFELTNFRNLGNQRLLVQPSADGASIDVQTGAGVGFEFDLTMETYLPADNMVGRAVFQNVKTEPNSRANLRLADWGRPAASKLTVQLRNLKTNQVIRSDTLSPR